MEATRFGRLDVETALARGYLPARVYVDGEEVQQAVVVDDVEGWVEHWLTDEDGNILTDQWREPRRARRYGVVTYVPHPRGVPGKWATGENVPTP